MTYPQRKAARRKQTESKASSAGVTANSGTGDVYDMGKIGAGDSIDRFPATADQTHKWDTCDRENGNPLADAGIGAKHTNNVEISHGDADSTWSNSSRQMIIHREMGWSVVSGDVLR